jgi:hypothetical protein
MEQQAAWRNCDECDDSKPHDDFFFFATWVDVANAVVITHHQLIIVNCSVHGLQLF